MSDWRERIDAMVREARADPRTDDELIAAILTEPDEDAAWDMVAVLHRRGTRQVFEAARDLCRSRCPVERATGADVLGQIGVPYRTYPEEAADAVINLLRTEADPAVIRAAVSALGHTPDARATGLVTALAVHPDPRIRWRVANTLGGHDGPLAVRTLVGLTSDSDPEVRDWAYFALGRLHDEDDPEIRDALLRGTTDSDPDARGEALVGLARRRDPRVYDPIVRELTASAVGEPNDFAVEAAGELADPRLLPVLMTLKAAANESDRYDAAIQRCAGPIDLDESAEPPVAP